MASDLDISTNLHNKPAMPRPHRIEYSGGWYLIENLAVPGQILFNDEDDYQSFLELLEEISQIFGVEVHGYSLLEDQYFLLIHTPKGQLSRAMRHLNGVYTQRYNQVWKNDGAVFKGRYKSVVIDPQRYLLDVLCYIHTRPVENGVSHKAVDHAWTSHRAYLKDKHRPVWLKTENILKPLGFIKAFALAKLNKIIAKGITEEFNAMLKKERVILGHKSFKEAVKEWAKQENSKNNSSQNHIAVANEILEFVSFAYKVPVDEIKKSQSGKQNEARSMAVYQLRAVGGLPQKEIAEVLHSSSGYTIAKTLQRFNDRMASDEELANTTAHLTQTIQEQLNK